MKSSVHAGHRKRVRETLEHTRLCDLSEVQQLEFILGFTIKVKDTNPQAHALLSKFKSLDGVVNSTVEDLITVEGIGPRTAYFLTSLPQINECILRSHAPKTVKLSSIQKTIEYSMKRIFDPTVETLLVLIVDAVGTLVNSITYSSNIIDEVQTSLAVLVKDLQRKNAKYVIFVHNHPDGDVRPSREDLVFTKKVRECLWSIDISLQDSIILGDTSAFSILNNTQYYYEYMDFKIPSHFKHLRMRNNSD